MAADSRCGSHRAGGHECQFVAIARCETACESRAHGRGRPRCMSRRPPTLVVPHHWADSRFTLGSVRIVQRIRSFEPHEWRLYLELRAKSIRDGEVYTTLDSAPAPSVACRCRL